MSSLVGFPDWQKIVGWFGAPLVSQSALAITNTNTTLGPFSVPSYNYLMVYARPLAAGRVEIVMPMSPGSAISITHRFSFDGIRAGVYTLPLSGGTVTVRIRTNAGNSTAGLVVVPTNIRNPLPTWDAGSSQAGILAFSSQTIGAGANFTLTPSNYWGQARLQVTSDQNAFTVTSVIQDMAAATIGHIFQNTYAGKYANEDVWIPPAKTVWTITNNAAVNATIDATLIAALGAGGY